MHVPLFKAIGSKAGMSVRGIPADVKKNTVISYNLISGHNRQNTVSMHRKP
jgi:hypothetical protein